MSEELAAYWKRDIGLVGAPAPDVFRAVFSSSPRPLLLMAADQPKYTMVAVNEAHARAFGTTPDALEGWGVLEVFGADLTPEAAGFVEEIRASLERVVASGAPDEMPVRADAVPGKTGGVEERYFSATNAPIFGPEGTLTHILSAVQDVTGEVLERRNEEVRALLMRELDHRARNVLTVVQSFVRLTTADNLEDFRRVLDGRVEALARVQTSLAASRWEAATLPEVVEGELVSLCEAGKYRISGPPLLLPPEQVQAMSMAIHELATNAMKYGSLSVPDGLLAVRWSQGADGACMLIWEETSSLALRQPLRQGFGTRLIAQLARQLGGEIAYVWRSDGLIATLRFRPGA